MTIYNVGEEEYLSLQAAKQAMRETGLPGFKTKVYANGDWIPCGEVKLTGNNRTFIANTRMSKANY